ncbi:sigma-70 family RNA polymerase sigma factor, partial [Kibdelosporangium lantanae]
DLDHDTWSGTLTTRRVRLPTVRSRFPREVAAVAVVNGVLLVYGIAATREICAHPSLDSVRVVVLTTFEIDEYVFAALRAGASGFLLKDVEPDDLRRVLATLDEREQHVIRLRYGIDDGQPRTLDQIGKRFGLSRERVRQIEREVMSKLRQGERAEKLRAYAS